MASHRRPALAVLTLLLLFVASGGSARGAEARQRSFSIAAADATQSLEAFASQSGVQLVYLVAQVRGTRTNRVQGRFTVQEALDRLLLRTGLRVHLDDRTGVYTVSAEPLRLPSAPPPSTVELADPGSAQAGIPPAIVTRLNPFEVAVQQDTSFRSSSVGSGSRLAVDLADVAAAYSVINRSFIEALGITDVAEAAGWATGQTFFFSEFGGATGDRYGQQGSYVSRGITNTPGSTFSMGGNTGNQLNFYQSGSSVSDSYAVESFDFGRGPNSAFFGNSAQIGFQISTETGLQGVASSQTKRARFDAAGTSITAEIGNWGHLRATLDHNRPLTRTTSMRINLVHSHQARYQHMSYSQIRAVNLAGTWKPGPRTNITLSGVNQTTRSKNPGTDVRENFSGWDGQTVFRGPVLNTFLSTTGTPGSIAPVAHPVYGQIQITGGPDRGTGAPFAGLTFNGEPQGIRRRTGNHFLLDTTTMTIMDWENFALTRQADATSRVPVYTRTAPNGAYFIRGTQPAFFNASNTNGTGPHNPYVPIRRGISGMPVDMYDLSLAGSRRPLPGPRDSMSNWVPNTIQRFKDFQFAIDHNPGENFYVSLGGDINRTRAQVRNEDALNSNPGLHIDVNQVRPDGSLNPYFLELYGFSQPTNGKGGLRVSDQWTADQAVRMNAIYNLDAGRWGQFIFNVNANANTRNYEGVSHGSVLNIPGIDTRRLAAEAALFNSTYHGDAIRTDVASVVDREFPFTNVSYDASGMPIVTNSLIRPGNILRAGGDGGDNGNETVTDTLTQYVALQTQAKLLDDRIALTLTGKRQFDINRRSSAVAQGDLPGPVSFTNTALGIASVNPHGSVLWDGISRTFRPTWPGSPEKYYTMTYQPLDPATGQPRTFATGPLAGQAQPRRLATNRPRVGDSVVTGLLVRDPLYQSLSPYGEQSFQDDFSPPESRKYSNTYSASVVLRLARGVSPFVNFSSQSLPPALADLDINFGLREVAFAKEVAFGSSFDLGSRLHFRWNYFRNTRVNSPAGNPVVSRVNDLINSRNAYDDLPGSTTNALGFIPLPASGDYTRTLNHGYEVELTLSNPVPGLRVTANGSAGSTGEDRASRFPLTKAWLLDPDHQAMMQSLLEDAGGMLDASQRPDRDNGTRMVAYAPGRAVPAPGVVPSASFALDQTRAVNAYNNAWVEYDILADVLAATRIRRAPYANFFADYTVQGGPVRGLGVGFGVQWQGPRMVYNKGGWTIVDPADKDRAIDDPLLTSQDIGWEQGARNFQANLSYTHRLANGGSLRFGLRINNPFNDDARLYGYALQQPERDLRKPNRVSLPIAAVHSPEPRNFRLATTYTFSGIQRR